MERWTRLMIRYRWAVVAVWLVVLIAGGWSSSKLSALLSNTYTMPGTDWERARTILKDQYGDRSDGSFTVVFRVLNASDTALREKLQGDLAHAAKEVPTGKARPLAPGGQHVLYGDIVSTLSIADAKGHTDDVLRALPHRDGVKSFVTGQAANKIYRAGNPSVTLNPNAVGATGGSHPHNNFQPYLCVDFIISLFGIFPSQT